MNIVKIIFTTGFLLGAILLTAQNIHISQNYLFPLLSHPSMAGDVNKGDMEFGALYRKQAFTITPNSYETGFAFVNASIKPNFKSDNRIGIALLLLNDNSGVGRLTTNKATLNVAYHFKFDSFLSDFSIGSQLSFISRNVDDFSAFAFEEDLVGSGFSEENQFNKNTFFDLGVGIASSIKLFRQSELKIGWSANHINLKKENLEAGLIQRFQLQHSGFAQLEFPFNENVYLLPSISYFQTQQNNDLQIQTLIGFSLNNIFLKSGLGVRYGDAMQVLLGAEMGKWEIGLAYDVNISDLAPASKSAAGLEIGVKFNYTRKKRPRKVEIVQPIPLLQTIPVIEKEEPIGEIVFIEKEVEAPREIELKKEQPIRLNDVYFDFNDDKILAEAEIELGLLLDLLKKHEDMIIELSSHTDSRGENQYNLELSQRRAESSKKWLTDNGIDHNRITAKGYGESNLLNHCKDAFDCSEEEHSINRRTEFKIIRCTSCVFD